MSPVFRFPERNCMKRIKYDTYGKTGCDRLMLKEYLSKQKSNSIHWDSGIEGILTCQFALHPAEEGRVTSISACTEPLHFEAFFCTKGRLVIEPLQYDTCVVEAPGIFLLSDSSGICSCQCSKDLGGIFVAVDAVAAKESLRTLCSVLKIELCTGNIKDRMAAANGYIVLSGTPWVQAFFENVKRLPDDMLDRYCIFKSVELFYLLCSGIPVPDKSECGLGRSSRSIMKIMDYIQEHLSEKITIQLLSRKFFISPTFLKENFHRACGMPVHTWLIQQRIKRAQELLCTTQMPIQEIARAVGYESISQFHAAFKGYSGVTPGQYRKMSETIV